MIEFKLPSLGADMDEGKLLEWKVKPGDAVRKGDVVAVVDTTKAAVEVETWQEGVVEALLALPGTTIPVGTVIARFLAPGEKPGAAAPAPPPVTKPVKKAAPAPAAAEASVPAAPPVTAVPAPSGRRPVSPAARRRARELGLDPEGIAGTGPHGAVTIDDVEKAAAQPAPAAAPVDRVAEMRKAIAAAMSRSKREIPHYYLAETIPMRRAQDWLAAENARRPLTGRILMAAVQLKAVALALRGFPDLNGTWRDGAYVPSASVNTGVAISLRQGGLVAPGIRDVQDLPLDELMAKLADLVKRARAGSLRSSEFSDPTITVTNLGDTGVETTYAVIYPPQAAIVGFGRVAVRPWVEEGNLVAMPAVVATVSADHRVSDGHRGAAFLAELSRRLQEPEKL
ncbi:MAG TPA: dihydrolipoamide acetyltransferase family protein [Usitatibacteraceae bacterium]|nr:dihydrolipoamide acetyltransferase family protein [Usitatibacteraceae bacterium]